MTFTLYRHVPVCSFIPSESPSLGLLETPQVAYLVVTPIYQDKHGRKGAGLSGQLITGHKRPAGHAGESLL